MASGNRPSGRKVKVGTGGGGVQKHGRVNVGGPVGGGYSRPSGGGASGGSMGDRGAGTRSGGGGILAVLAAILIGKAVSGGSDGGGNGSGNKSGCLKRIIIYAVIALVIYFLVKSCSGIDLSSYTGYGAGDSGLPVYTEPAQEEPVANDFESSASDVLQSLLGGTTATVNGVQTASASANVYKAHEPDYTVDSAARARYTLLNGNGQDVTTVMVYMCGADLESKSGMGTSDLQEMLSATIGSNVNIIVETGGASYWQNQVVSSSTNQIYQVMQGGLRRLEKSFGKKSMVKASTLTEFINYCTKEFPADRNMLILWDHGGGSITGYGYDELFSSDGSMALDQFNTALNNAGAQFDFIGFDACLMGSLETALVLDQYADYMIASEATEPGTGWYYTNWITQLSKDPSVSTLDLGKTIIDDFVKYSAQSAPQSSATLSLIDLAEMHGTVPVPFQTFSEATGEMIASDGFQQVANARSGAKDFSASSRINQIDLIHFADNLNTDESRALADVLRGCVKYNRCGNTIANANGVSIYFPYNSLSKVSTALNTYEKIGVDESYTACIRSFASMAAGGSLTSGGSSSALGSLLGDSSSGSLLGALLGGTGESSYSYDESSSGSVDAVSELLGMFLGDGRDRSAVTGDADSSWIDENLLMGAAPYFADHSAGFDGLTLTKKNGQTVLELTEAQWAQVKTLEQNVFLDDGAGYIDLGLDTVMEYNEDGDLIMDYNGTWLSVNGQIVSYYFVSQDELDDGTYTIVGRIPAMLTHNDRSTTENALLSIDGAAQDYPQANRDTKAKKVTEYVNLIVVFDNANEYGTVVGALKDYQGKTDSVMKGLMPIQKGDKIQFLCDYYTYGGEYVSSYELNDPITATGEWTIENLPVQGGSQMTYRITDLYGAQYWTPTVTAG